METEIKEKRCTRCGRTLPVALFYKKTSSPDGYQYYCKACQNAMNHNSKSHAAPHAAAQSELSRFTPRQLLDELKAWGYSGELTYTKKIRL